MAKRIMTNMHLENDYSRLPGTLHTRFDPESDRLLGRQLKGQ